MLDLLKLLQNTPIPSILVIGGIAFLLMSFVSKLGSNIEKSGSNIEIEPGKKGIMGFIGFVLLGVGIGLYLIPAMPEVTFSANSVNSVEQPQATEAQIQISSISGCDGTSWANCWQIDDTAQTITWVGITNGATDIAPDGLALQKIKAGYTAIITIDVAMTINICTGTIDGVKPSGTCPKILPISAGTHRIISPGESGGFRIYP